MRGVDDEEVNAGLGQRLRAELGVLADAHRGADDQPARVILGGVGELLALGEVLHRDQPAQPAASSTSGSFSTLCWASSRSASSGATPTGAVTSGIGVITSTTRRP